MGRSSNKLSLVRDETTVGYGVVNIRFDPHEDIDEQFKLVTHRKRADVDVVHDGQRTGVLYWHSLQPMTRQNVAFGLDRTCI